jgi:hypothetical protein
MTGAPTHCRRSALTDSHRQGAKEPVVHSPRNAFHKKGGFVPLAAGIWRTMEVTADGSLSRLCRGLDTGGSRVLRCHTCARLVRNLKNQAPNPKQLPNPKFQLPKPAGSGSVRLELVITICLGFGDCDLKLAARAALRSSHHNIRRLGRHRVVIVMQCRQTLPYAAVGQLQEVATHRRVAVHFGGVAVGMGQKRVQAA